VRYNVKDDSCIPELSEAFKRSLVKVLEDSSARERMPLILVPLFPASPLGSFHRISTVIVLSPSIAACVTIYQVSLMTTEENIRALSRRVTAAPENSEEFQAVMDKIRANVKARAARGRERTDTIRRTLSHSQNADERTYSAERF